MRRIGISQRAVDVPPRQERRDCLDQAWAQILWERGCIALPLPNRIAEPARLLRDVGIHGVILSGGNDLAHLPGATDIAPERDRMETALLDACASEGIPVLGVCRGMQLMVVHYGGTVERVEGHVATRHALWAPEGNVLGLTDRAEVNSYHSFGVDSGGLGTDVLPVAWTMQGEIEAVAHRYLRQWGIMWHPEREPRDPRDVDLMMRLFGQGPR